MWQLGPEFPADYIIRNTTAPDYTLELVITFSPMLGLFAFFYVSLHFLVYAGLDQRFDLAVIFEDIIERPYITLGITGLLLLIPLAITSTAGMMRRLGRRWSLLHRLVYLVPILGTWHFYWQVKKDVTEPLVYVGILLFLLGFRVFAATRKKRHIIRAQAKLQAGLSTSRS